MIDSRGLIQTPKSVRFIAVLLLLMTVVLSVCVVIYYIAKDTAGSPQYADWVLAAMSMLNLALSGLAIAAVVFFSEREINSDALIAKTELFLRESVPQALARVSCRYELRRDPASVERLGRSDIFGAAYEVVSEEEKIRLWIGLNVTRLFVIFWVRVPPESTPQSYCEQLRHLFQFTFGGAEHVGFKTTYEPFVSDSGESLVSIWSTVDTAHNLLVEPAQRLFWLQDVAMMTESFWRTALRNNVLISSSEPSPL